MKLGKCKDCIHWGNKRVSPGEDVKHLRGCSSPKFIYGYGSTIEGTPIDGAAIEDDEGWGMVTGPEFGCIHFKAP